MSEVTMEDRASALENEYFHRQEQELIEKMRTKLASENTGVSQNNCPKCADSKLTETTHENVTIDVCGNCHGIWLDAGELAQVVGKDEGKGWFGRLFG